jgi:hypothetical protein
MSGYENVERVDQAGQPQPLQSKTNRAGRVELDQQQHARASVAGNGCAVPEHEPPALAASVRCDRSQQPTSLLVGEREQAQLAL